MKKTLVLFSVGVALVLPIGGCGGGEPETEPFRFTDGPEAALLETHGKFREYGYDLTPGDVQYYANEVCRSLDAGETTITTVVDAMNRIPRYNNTDHQLMHRIVIADNCPQHEGKLEEGR
ncbi:hypothetical protein ACTHQW_13760 [Dietzia maris]